MKPPIVLIIGWTGSTKTTVAQIVAELTGGKPGDTFSVILPHAAKALDVSTQEITERKAEIRRVLRMCGGILCRDDPAALIKTLIAQGATAIAGCRRREEIEAARPLVDAILWIHRPGVYRGETDDIDPGQADWHINNTGTLDDLRGQTAAWLAYRRNT